MVFFMIKNQLWIQWFYIKKKHFHFIIKFHEFLEFSPNEFTTGFFTTKFNTHLRWATNFYYKCYSKPLQKCFNNFLISVLQFYNASQTILCPTSWDINLHSIQNNLYKHYKVCKTVQWSLVQIYASWIFLNKIYNRMLYIICKY